MDFAILAIGDLWKLRGMGLDRVDLEPDLLGWIDRRPHPVGRLGYSTCSSSCSKCSCRWTGSCSQQTAKEILCRRFARGEITREQYQQMLDDLS